MKTIIMILAMVCTLPAMGQYVMGTVYDPSGTPLQGVRVSFKGVRHQVTTDQNGFYTLHNEGKREVLLFTLSGYETQEVKIAGRKIIDITLKKAKEPIVVQTAPHIREDVSLKMNYAMTATPAMARTINSSGYTHSPTEAYPLHNTEAYATIHENGFRKVLDKPLSTFSIDVDAASYSNVRRFINMGQLPPKDAVRIEEMINYFDYRYETPKQQEPFALHSAMTHAPWNKNHYVVRLALQAPKIAVEDLPASNIVFLIDVSGSMSAPNKLPLLKAAFKLLTQELRPQDKVSIVVYAGAAGVVLDPTSGDQKQTIIEALDRLKAGGSTAGGAGIQLAYQLAQDHFIEGGNNRVILASDGDFNVGASSDAEMERLIEAKREEGIFLTVLGLGTGNYKDSKMEILADKGNGNYAYIDTMKEAKKVLVSEWGSTLHTLAKDVKIQVEFNPSVVQAYRLIGYENRKLQDEDFNDDQKDAGELGSGQSVTALYEIIPVGIKSEFIKEIDPLKYQSNPPLSEPLPHTDELLTVKFRYKAPDENKSELITHIVKNELQSDPNLTWSLAVAGFGMILRSSPYKGEVSYASILALARSAKGLDPLGYRQEFISLVELGSRLDPKPQ